MLAARFSSSGLKRSRVVIAVHTNIRVDSIKPFDGAEVVAPLAKERPNFEKKTNRPSAAFRRPRPFAPRCLSHGYLGEGFFKPPQTKPGIHAQPAPRLDLNRHR